MHCVVRRAGLQHHGAATYQERRAQANGVVHRQILVFEQVVKGLCFKLYRGSVQGCAVSLKRYVTVVEIPCC